MNIKSRWLFFCAGEPEFATQEDWEKFTQLIYAEWRQTQLDKDSEAAYGQSQTMSDIQKYGFEEFAKGSALYKELEDTRPREFD